MRAWSNLKQSFRAWWANTKGYLAVGSTFLALALLVIVVVQAIDLREKYPVINWGNVWEPFAAIGTFGAVVVALWQSIVIRRQAKDDAKEAAERFQTEINAANERTVHEVEAAERRFQREQQAAAQQHQVEMDTQRELARIQRVYLREQEFKLALIRVARAANAYTHELATLLAETQRIIALPTRQERDDAIKPIAKKMNLVSHDLRLEVSGAHMLTNDDDLHDALDRITEATIQIPIRANEYQNTMIMAGQTPDAVPLYLAMEEVNRVVGDAIRATGELLVTGWD